MNKSALDLIQCYGSDNSSEEELFGYDEDVVCGEKFQQKKNSSMF